MLFLISSYSYAQTKKEQVPLWQQAKMAYEDEDYKKAYQLAQWSNTQHHKAEAQMLLAKMYYYGRGVKSDKKKFMSLLKQAASQGLPWAQIHLASFYYAGKGTFPKNLVYAYMWLDLGMQNHAKESEFEEFKKGLTDSLNKKELKQAQQLVTRCLQQKYQNCET